MTDVRMPFHPRRASTAGRRRSAGFTLIELMVTVAIVGILMAIAIESYEFATVKTRRGAAEGCLLESAQYMERYYTTNLKYTDATLPTCSTDVSPHYTIAFSGTPDAKSYTVQATPVVGYGQHQRIG